MKILLDSHALLWFALGDRRCSLVARTAIDSPGASVHVSAASAWEISTKVRLGKWPEAAEFEKRLTENLGLLEFLMLAITLQHGQLAGSLPASHKDPFDRMLAAQALTDDLVLVTADPAFRSFGVPTIW